MKTLKSIRRWGHVLPALLAVLTQRPRYLPEIKWSDQSWTHNIFRVYELVFWRRYGLRKEATTYQDGEGLVRINHTFEAKCAHFETRIRDMLDFSWVNSLQLQRGAIAFDNAALSTAFPSFSYTCTGSNLILIAGYFGNTVGGTITGYTYNSVSMTLINDRTVGAVGTQHVGLFYLINPSTGSNTLARVGTDASGNHMGISYSGAKQSSQPDASATGVSDVSTTVTATLTTVADNSWAVAYVRGDAGEVVSNNSGVCDTALGGNTYGWDSGNALTPAGAKTVSFSAASLQSWGAASASISPAGSANFGLLLMGVGT